MQFASEYSIYRGEVKKRGSPVIVRTFPNYSDNPRGENYPAAWCDLEDVPEVWIAEYHAFLLTEFASQVLPHFSQELHHAEQRIAQEVDSDDDEPIEPSEQQDDWMLLCQPSIRPICIQTLIGLQPQEIFHQNWSEKVQIGLHHRGGIPALVLHGKGTYLLSTLLHSIPNKSNWHLPTVDPANQGVWEH